MKKIYLKFNQLNIELHYNNYIITYSHINDYHKKTNFFVINSIYNKIKKQRMDIFSWQKNHKSNYDKMFKYLTIHFKIFRFLHATKTIFGKLTGKIFLIILSFYILLMLIMGIFHIDYDDIKYCIKPNDLPHYSVVRKWSRRFKLNWKDIYALIMVESLDTEKAKSPVNAKGLGQIMSSVEAWAKPILKNELKSTDIYNPDCNLAITCLYLKSLITYFNGDIYQAVESYNLGLECYLNKTKTAKFYVSQFMLWDTYIKSKY